MAAEASASLDVDLSLLWHQLTGGLHSIVDCFFSEDDCYLLVTRNEVCASSLDGRRLAILEGVLAGLQQKNIAMELGLAPSTIALNARLALETLGLKCKPSRAHPLLMLAARAGRESRLTLARCSSLAARNGNELRVVAVARPERILARALPCAELKVIRSLIEGLTYQQIAQRRGTSTRTIANQITAVFRRLRVSGRNELVQRLFSEEGVGGLLVKPLNETLVPAKPRLKQDARLEAARRSA